VEIVMVLKITPELIKGIYSHGEAAYPEEGAGLLLGKVQGDDKQVTRLLSLENAREDDARHNRYLLTPQEYIRGEQVAIELGLLGVFHSHPDHPNRPSEFDREWAMPWFSYVITSVNQGRALASRSWLLSEDRTHFVEEEIIVSEASEA
jgi:proteasome lid subunit RPN8/RPN11